MPFYFHHIYDATKVIPGVSGPKQAIIHHPLRAHSSQFTLLGIQRTLIKIAVLADILIIFSLRHCLHHHGDGDVRRCTLWNCLDCLCICQEVSA